MFMKKCPYCKELIKRSAILCKHCNANLGSNENYFKQQKDEGIRFMQNGFAKINSECDAIEEKMELRTGLVFIKYQYSSEDLFSALNRVKTYLEKMSDDLDEWVIVNKANQKVKSLFEKKAEETYQRMESLYAFIEQREPTWWEKVKEIFKWIFGKLLSYISVNMMAGKAVAPSFAAA